MTKLTKLRIHICPIGYEVDRIVLAAEQLRADRVWLITEKNPSKETAGKFIHKVKLLLRKNKIEVEEIGVDRDDLFDNLKIIREVFVKESGNEIHVNVSAGSKIQAIAGMMGCMMFKEYSPIPYYVEPKKYETPLNKPQSTGIRRILSLPDYTIQKPDNKLVKALQLINKNNNKITKKNLAELAIIAGLIEPANKNKKVDQSAYAKLDHHIIKPLLDQWKFISVEKIGQNHWIIMTENGIDASKFLIQDSVTSN